MPVTLPDITSALNQMNDPNFFRTAFSMQQAVTFGPIKNLITSAVGDPYTKSALLSIINNLKEFSGVLNDSVLDPTILNVPDIIPPTNSHHYAADLISAQTDMDLARISVIISQRQTGSALASFLQDMDKKAMPMINWAVERGLFGSSPAYTPDIEYDNRKHIEPCPAPLVFFGGNETSRTVPYTPVAPLALPTEMMDLALRSPQLSLNDYQLWFEPSLAYQVGRLIFWKGEMPNPSEDLGSAKFARFLNLQMQEKGCSEWVSNAVASIFADVFSTIWCGNAAVGYAIRRATSKTNETYLAEDMRYQLPWFLRPYVALETLNLMTTGGDDYVDLKAFWETEQKKLNFSLVREYSTYDANNPDRNSICKLAENQITPKEVTVYSAGKSFNLSFNAALAEILDATREVYRCITSLGVISVSDPTLPTPIASPWLDGSIWRSPHSKAFVPENPGINYFIEVWLTALFVQTRHHIMLAADKGVIPSYIYESYYHEQKVYWTTAMYAGGWLMESSGNSGGPH